MKQHVNIPIFIPHLGCPNMCVFCNQRTISGVTEFDPSQLSRIIDDALSTVKENQSAEIAFFGGSFTGIDRGLMINLLEIANKYVASGRVASIRCSTRPDYIDEEILDVLELYNVKVIELGLQSVNDNVLLSTKRGHDSLTAKRACEMIVKRGFTLVGQMMIGLPSSSLENELETADFIIKAGARYARIYPTVVFLDTELCEMAKKGEYTPITLDAAVARSAAVCKRLIENGVEPIRIGLCASDNLLSDKTYFDGPNHPAIGELVTNEIYYNIIKEKLNSNINKDTSHVDIYVPKNALSKAIGQKRANLHKLRQEYEGISFRFIACEKLSQYEVLIESRREENQCT